MSKFNVFAEYNIIKKLKHLEYLRVEWLPTFVNKFKEKHNKKQLCKIVIAKFLKQYFFPKVDNMTEMELSYIPGKYRKRLLITNSNLVNANNNDSTNNNSGTNNNSSTNNDNTNNNIDDILNKSLLEYQQNAEKSDMEKAISESLHLLGNDFIIDGSDDEFDEAVLLSLSVNNISFYVSIDLRVYGVDPKQPIYVNDKKYYLTNEQTNNVVSLWNKINSGLKYDQLVEYYKTMTKDLLLIC